MDQPAVILEYWFSPQVATHWFASTPALDDEIRARFEPLWQQAAAGGLDHWADTPEGALALAIVLDQLPLHMYRGQMLAHASERQAVAVAKAAVARQFHARLPRDRLLFLFMPLMHSEDGADQALSVSLFQEAGLDTRWPEHHRDLILRFGRFPHRNAVLGRASTREELDYLASGQAFKG